MLRIENLSVRYDGLQALSDVSLTVAPRDFISVIGANGAGKTTLFKAISGAVPAVAGSIVFFGEDLLKVRPCDRPHRGIAHVPEGRQVFPTLSVFENLQMGAFTQTGRRQWKSNIDLIYAMFPVLAERRGQFAGMLSGGEQQMLAIGRGLAASPKLLMLDEPSMGLAPAIVELIFERIKHIHRNTETTILLVEQRVAEALKSCTRGYVLEGGRVTMQGAYEDISRNDRIRRAYLGL
jgi:branched-chain amino acid transport system ATP-binding protein